MSAQENDAGNCWLVIGLGNPGPEYEWSPHNAGFLVIDRLGERNSIRVSRPDSQALVGLGSIAGKDVILAKPQTYMNLSGGSARLLAAKYRVPPGRILIVYDDLDLPWQSVRLRMKGSPAGHNGMKSLVSSLGTQEFPRVRIGIHPGHPLGSGKDFLLSPVKKGQRQEWDSLLDYASQAVESAIADGVEKAMTKFNRRAEGSTKEEA
ncbi:MAG: aminoacyl-tRNA hydrolase [Bryobacteraceae bacterium]|nr:aminoacyl-tRNA hydrolase [Bryobacteraceae bacterium]